MPEILDDIANEIGKAAPVVNDTIVQTLIDKDKAADAELGIENPPQTKPLFTDTSTPTPLQPDVFDPAIHEGGPNGVGVRTKDGRFRRKRGGPSGGVKTPASVAVEVTKQAVKDYRGTASFLCQLVFGSCEGFLGAHWRPSDGERSNIENATARYCEAHDWGDLPPGIMLAVVVAAYAVPRAVHPDTQTRVRELGYSIGIGHRPAPPPPPPTPPPQPTAAKPNTYNSGPLS